MHNQVHPVFQSFISFHANQPVGKDVVDGAVDVEVLVELHVLPQLEALREGLLADGAHGADLTSVGAHVVQEILPLAEHVT